MTPPIERQALATASPYSLSAARTFRPILCSHPTTPALPPPMIRRVFQPVVSLRSSCTRSTFKLSPASSSGDVYSNGRPQEQGIPRFVFLAAVNTSHFIYVSGNALSLLSAYYSSYRSPQSTYQHSGASGSGRARNHETDGYELGWSVIIQSIFIFFIPDRTLSARVGARWLPTERRRADRNNRWQGGPH